MHSTTVRLKFFKNAYIHTLSEENYPDYIHWLSINRRIYLKLEDIKNIVKSENILTAFTPQKTSKEFLNFLIDFLKVIFNYFHNSEDAENSENNSTIEKEISNQFQQEKDFIYHFIINLQLLQKRIEENLYKISVPLLRKLTLDYLRVVKIPFTGDTDSGIQIMGFLETRTLDFKNVFILSVNEGQLPSERKLNSFIPYSVRKAFKMPTFEEQDAIYCYHFYRLLQRAENIYLLYDTEVKSGGGSGEKSRFISQLMRIVTKRKEATKVKISQEIISINPPKNTNEIAKIEIEKTENVLAEMDKFLLDPKDSEKVVKYFSPTALSNYLECPLRFYFLYVAELKSSDENSEKIEAVDLGNVVHECLENIYKPFTQKTLNKEDYDGLIDDAFITNHIEQVLINHYFISESCEELTGRNIILFNIIFQIIKSVLKKDVQQTPFSIFSVEQKSKRQKLQLDAEKTILLSGTIDRVDQPNPSTNETLRVVDYKTGFVKMNEPKKKINDSEYIEKYFNDTQLKSGLQAYFYTYLFKQQNALRSTAAGIYSLKEVNKGVQMLRKGSVISDELLSLYEENLKKYFGEIFDTTIPFRQTEDEKKCLYCNFKDICSR